MASMLAVEEKIMLFKCLLLLSFLTVLFKLLSSVFGWRGASREDKESSYETPSIVTDPNHFNRVGGPQHDSMDTQLIDLGGN